MSGKFESAAEMCCVPECGYRAVYVVGSRGWCCFHAELYERGPEFVKALPLVTRFANHSSVKGLLKELSAAGVCMFDDEDSVEIIDRIQQKGSKLGIDPEILRRREFVDGIGECVPEPMKKYASRLKGYLARFIVDRACEKVGLPAVGQTKDCRGGECD